MCATLCNNVGLSFLGDFQIPQQERRSWGSPRKSLGFPKKKLGNPFVHEPQNWDCSLREVGHFQDDCATVRRLGNWSFSKKSTENKLVNWSSDKQSESVKLQPQWMVSTQLTTWDPRDCPGPLPRCFMADPLGKNNVYCSWARIHPLTKKSRVLTIQSP